MKRTAYSVIHHQGTLEREDLQLRVVEQHRSPLTRQIHEGVELECNKADVVMNSKTEWNHSKIPRIMIEVGDKVEEDTMSGMSRSTELGGKERGEKSLKIRNAEKREREQIGEVVVRREGCHKRVRPDGTPSGTLEGVTMTSSRVGQRGRLCGTKRGKERNRVNEKWKEGKEMEGEGRLLEWLRVYGIDKTR